MSRCPEEAPTVAVLEMQTLHEHIRNLKKGSTVIHICLPIYFYKLILLIALSHFLCNLMFARPLKTACYILLFTNNQAAYNYMSKKYMSKNSDFAMIVCFLKLNFIWLCSEIYNYIYLNFNINVVFIEYILITFQVKVVHCRAWGRRRQPKIETSTFDHVKLLLFFLFVYHLWDFSENGTLFIFIATICPFKYMWKKLMDYIISYVTYYIRSDWLKSRVLIPYQLLKQGKDIMWRHNALFVGQNNVILNEVIIKSTFLNISANSLSNDFQHNFN